MFRGKSRTLKISILTLCAVVIAASKNKEPNENLLIVGEARRMDEPLLREGQNAEVQKSFFLGSKDDCEGGPPITDEATCRDACNTLDLPIEQLSGGFKCYKNKNGKCIQNDKSPRRSRLVCETQNLDDAYQPGTPGAEWSEDEIDIVREKVIMLLHGRTAEEKVAMFGKKVAMSAPGFNDNLFDLHVTEMALFRLAFHDCFAYKDGSGGCDGCLNGPLNGKMPPSPFKSVKEFCQHNHEKQTKTDNNGLDLLVKALEKIYVDPKWPPGAANLTQSLKATGKSRADLWQFAANVALEKTIERSNHGCRYDYYQRQQVPLLENEGKGFAYGVWKCKIKLEKPIKFMFGRRDCVPQADAEFPYITDKEEAHSNPHANADEILADVKKNLRMPARDLIALSSIHGMIHPFGKGSIGEPYAWVGSGPNLSNMYYKLLANRPTYINGRGFGMGKGLVPYVVGDVNGNPVASRGFRVSCSDCWNTTQLWMGGPCVWRPGRLESAKSGENEVMTSCFGGFDENNKRVKNKENSCGEKEITFTPVGIQKGFSPSGKHSGRVWSNMFLLNYEVGLYKKFGIDDVAMRPTGCNLDLPKPDTPWEGNAKLIKTHGVAQSELNTCPVNELEDETSKPIYKIVEEFADDHDVWARSFLDAWARMQSTGYDDLKAAPQNSWLGYHTLIHTLNATIDDDFEKFINEHKPVVFTSENEDPFVCGHHAGWCYKTVSQAYAEYKNGTGIPMEIAGEKCTNFTQCNDPTHGDIPE